jgi:hypothetical protein
MLPSTGEFRTRRGWLFVLLKYGPLELTLRSVGGWMASSCSPAKPELISVLTNRLNVQLRDLSDRFSRILELRNDRLGVAQPRLVLVGAFRQQVYPGRVHLQEAGGAHSAVLYRVHPAADLLALYVNNVVDSFANV